MDIIIGLSVLAAIAAVYFGRLKYIDWWKNYKVPDPKSLRSDILYGSFGSYSNTAEQEHFNLFWCVPHWEGLDKAILDLRLANKFTVLDLQDAIFEKVAPKTTFTPRIDKEARLRTLFNRLKEEKVLHLVKVLSPIDEPNLPETATDDYMVEVVDMVRRIASEYSELNGVKIGVIFYADRPMQHVEIYDILGFDDYGNKSGILRPRSTYDNLVKRLRPDQRTWLVPGGTYGQDPKPFVNFAHSHHEVMAIIPFIWRVPPWEKEFKGIEDIPEMKAKYIEASKSLIF